MGQRLWWMLPGLLVWGGCAAGALLNRSDSDLVEPNVSAVTPVDSGEDDSAKQPVATADELASLDEFKRVARDRGMSESAISGVVESIRTADPSFRLTFLALAQAMLPPESAPSGPRPQATEEKPDTLQTVRQRFERVQPVSHRDTNSTTSRLPGTTSSRRESHMSAAQADPARATLAGERPVSSMTRATENRMTRSRLPVEVPDSENLDQQAPTAERGSRGHRSPASLTSADSGVTSAEPAALAWRKQLRMVINQLHQELEKKSLDEAEQARLEACLGLLHIVAEDTEQAIESLGECRNEQELEFWRQTVMALGILLDSDELPKFKHRVELATDHLRKGDQALATLGPLRLRNLALCTKVNGFGDFEEFGSFAFRPGQPVLLYVEVENYTVEETGTRHDLRSPLQRGLRSAPRTPEYETELSGRYEIVDATQRTVATRILPVDRNRCRNHRRDYFIPYMLHMPEKIAPGSYTLELTIEDKKGNKFGNGVIDFRVK